MLWDRVAEGQENGMPPYVYNLFKEVILGAWKARQDIKGLTDPLGLSRQEIMKKHFEVYGRSLSDWRLRQEIIPMLDNAGLISQEKDPNDPRRKLIYPTLPLTISDKNI